MSAESKTTAPSRWIGFVTGGIVGWFCGVIGHWMYLHITFLFTP
jgi:hypothetical protein